MLIACTHAFADSPARLLRRGACVCPWCWQRREGCKAKISFSFVGINIYNFASLYAHPQQLASVIIHITTFSNPASSYPTIFFFSHLLSGKSEKIQFPEVIEFIITLITQSKGSHIATAMSLILKMKGNKTDGWVTKTSSWRSFDTWGDSRSIRGVEAKRSSQKPGRKMRNDILWTLAL